MADTLTTLRAELARCEKELEQAREDGRASHVRIQAAIIRLQRARKALEMAMEDASE